MDTPLALVPVLLSLQVFTVDDDMPADFSDIPEAIDAANPGDALRVHPGNYSPFVLDKALRIVADGHEQVTVTATSTTGSEIRAIAAGSNAYVSGIMFESADEAGAPPTLTIADVDGVVTLSQVGSGGYGAPATIVIEDAAEVLIYDSDFGGGGTGQGLEGKVALHLTDSSVWMTSSSVIGGRGVNLPGSNGLAGIRVIASDIFVTRSNVRGGYGNSEDDYAGHGIHATDGSRVEVLGGLNTEINGGYNWGNSVNATGGGGSAIVLEASVGVLQADVPVAGGSGGSLGSVIAPALVVDDDSTLTTLNEIFPTGRSQPSQAEGGDLFHVQLEGEVASAHLLLFAPAAIPGLELPGVDGAFYLDPGSWSVLAALVMDAGGYGSIGFTTPLAPALVGVAVWFQGLQVEPAYQALSNPISFAVL